MPGVELKQCRKDRIGLNGTQVEGIVPNAVGHLHVDPKPEDNIGTLERVTLLDVQQMLAHLVASAQQQAKSIVNLEKQLERTNVILQTVQNELNQEKQKLSDALSELKTCNAS